MTILVGRSAEKQLDRIPNRMRLLVLAQIKKLELDPHPNNSKKLTNCEEYRIRIGDYRTIYKIDKFEKKITILSVLHRKDAYRK